MANNDKQQPGPINNQPQTELQQAGDKVFVTCKLENGLMMRIDRMVEMTETTLAGERRVNLAVQDGTPVRLNGSQVPFGFIPNWRIAHGFGITSVDRSFWDKWFAVHKESDLVKNSLVAGHTSEARAVDWTKEHASVTSGLQPISSESDPRTKKLLMGAQGIVGFGADLERMTKSGNAVVL